MTVQALFAKPPTARRPLRTHLWALMVSMALLTVLAPPAQAAPGFPSTNVAWAAAASDADIDALFSRAKAEKKPVLLYWGATWCPPCNQLKATLFNRQEFASLARNFVAVHVDGDRPGAQKLGTRFKVRGYPTVILMAAEGAEITRLPGEADAPQILAVLQAGLAGGRPIKAVLAQARAGQALSAAEWRQLAFYSWDTDQAQLVSEDQRPALLAELARLAPSANPQDAETKLRLWLKALAASDDGKGVKPDAALRASVQGVLADPSLARTHMDVLVNNADNMLRLLSAEDSPERSTWARQFDTALAALQRDASLSRSDRVSALYSRVQIARAGLPRSDTAPKLPPALLADVREMAKRMDREITDGYERQAVITSLAQLQGLAGLWADSEALLRANLAKSHSPYYLMSQLGGQARQLGKTDEALRWYAQAFEQSVGPATRLQWGVGYLRALVALAPQDAPRIEQLATLLLKEAATDKGAFFERSARDLRRLGQQLSGWGADAKHVAVMQRLRKQLDATCSQVDAADGQRAACQRLFTPGAATEARAAPSVVGTAAA